MLGAPIRNPAPPQFAGCGADLNLDTAPALTDEAANPNTVSAFAAPTRRLWFTPRSSTALALDLMPVQKFWESPPVEVRLATATYLYLLEKLRR